MIEYSSPCYWYKVVKNKGLKLSSKIFKIKLAFQYKNSDLCEPLKKDTFKVSIDIDWMKVRKETTSGFIT